MLEKYVQAREDTFEIEYERRIKFIINLLEEYYKQDFKSFNVGMVLDIGCYTGTISKYINCRYIGLDKLSIFKGDGEFLIHDLDIGYLPFEDKQFDLEINTDVLEHLAFPEKIIKDMERILVDDGILLISLPNESGLKGTVQRLFFPPKTWTEQRDFNHLWYFNIKIAREFVSEYFDIVMEFPYFGGIISKIPFVMRIKCLCSSWFMICKKKQR